MELYCAENEIVQRSYTDPALLQGDVLRNLLTTEERYLPSTAYFLGDEVKPYMRKMVATWMCEVSPLLPLDHIHTHIYIYIILLSSTNHELH